MSLNHNVEIFRILKFYNDAHTFESIFYNFYLKKFKKDLFKRKFI